MKEENLNNKKQEWVTPEIKNLGLEDTEGKQSLFPIESSLSIEGPS